MAMAAAARGGDGCVRSSCQEDLLVLSKLLRKNRSQHRRGRYFRELDMLARSLKAYLGRVTALQGTHRDALLVSCAQLERLGLLVARCASTLTSLLARTHFMPFSLVALTLVARLRVLLAHELSESVRSYNNNTSTGSCGRAPEFMRLSWTEAPYPKVCCHFPEDFRDTQVEREERDLREEEDELCVIDDKCRGGEEEDLGEALERRKKKAKMEPPKPEPKLPSPKLPSRKPPKQQPKQEPKQELKPLDGARSNVAFVAVEASSSSSIKKKKKPSNAWRALVPLQKPGQGDDSKAASEIDDIFKQLSSKKKKKNKKL
ncbi:hypothetical protein HOP50_12g66070 [Chloropicon primus]|uniref:Nucleolus and neural progenitor protein-like N-terminal domain-containing protein n=2 Tax=Chloropicon primus TaxID=1764295 RepID=A0A5B8MX82_9CHLO|nr:hypothetical protein A3770_12p65880 [Chloropicon primus]UPR03278.1 hypothetical protein HOP50_12g66070 [Chloropicon primus]|eukprot:QDZ24070.1 hypothetical protein A3770_12p65880 [Chloropicon primus]